MGIESVLQQNYHVAPVTIGLTIQPPLANSHHYHKVTSEDAVFLGIMAVASVGVYLFYRWLDKPKKD